jgi:hypothetical protein
MKTLLHRSLLGAVSLLALAPHAGAESPCTTRSATVLIEWESPGFPVQGVVARVSLPPGLRLDREKGKGRAAENLTGLDGGLFDAVPRDSNGDGADDLVTIGLVASDIPKGRFATMRFECDAGAPTKGGEVSCTLEAAGAQGDVPGSCRVEWDALPSDRGPE